VCSCAEICRGPHVAWICVKLISESGFVPFLGREKKENSWRTERENGRRAGVLTQFTGSPNGKWWSKRPGAIDQGGQAFEAGHTCGNH
jgi:hypothetical protein